MPMRSMKTARIKSFSRPEMKPWEMFEKMFGQTKRTKAGLELAVEGTIYTLKKEEQSERIIYCP